MAIPFLTPSRTVLLIGDEALYVYKVLHNAVKLVDGVPWQTEDFEDVVVGLIRKDCGGKPVLIFNDMTDQHFKGGQRLPKVGSMDKANVLKRKLQVAFPNYPIRGALPIRLNAADVAGKQAKKGAGLYLFAAVPISEQIVKTLEAVKLSMVSIAGFTLLPVEASDMVRALSIKVAGKKKIASRWVVFIGQHQNGALRQVIIRDGQLAMTRMTPVSDSDSDPRAWAQEVAQEFKATVSYLSRFGYSPDDGTDVIVVAGQESGEALEKLIDTSCNYSSFSVSEAARLLGVGVGFQDDARYAEPLHVAWAGRKSKFILPMDAAEITKIHQPRQMAAAAIFLLIMAGGFLAWQLTGMVQTLVSVRDDLSVQRSVLAEAEADYEQEVARMEALGFDIKLIQGAIGVHEDFEAGRMKLLPLFKEIGIALGDDIRLDTLVVNQIEEEYTAADTIDGDDSKEAKLEATLSLSFPPTIELEFGIRAINDLEKRLRDRLPKYAVDITRQVARPEYTQNIKGVAGKTAQEITAEEDYLAELVIRGPKE